MPRKNRGYKRGKPFRDSRLFVIVCEGEKRERLYFEEIDKLSQRIKIRVLEPKEDDKGKSAPKWLLERAANYEAEFDINNNDILWFVIDVDRWKGADLRVIQEECERKSNWSMALSNPCFEVWIYMHFSGIEKSTSEKCKEFKSELDGVVKGGYNAEKAIGYLKVATERAKESDTDPKHFMPQPKSTKLYLLTEDLLKFIG